MILIGRVKMWETIVASFFYNLPLRVMTEAYVELCVYTFININNVSRD